MADLRLIRASDGTGNASMPTIQATRSPLATTIIVDTVNNLPTHFVASMGTPHTFTDPITSEVITVISEATCVDFVGHLDSGSIEIDSIAPGYTDIGSAVGDIVIIKPTTQWANNVADTLAVTHDDDGSLKDEIVTEEKLADESVSTRTLGQGVVTSDNIDWATVGVKIGVISGTTLGTTGNKTITGVGFRPRLVRFTQLAAYSDTAVTGGSGAMDSSGNQYFTTFASFSGNNSSWSGDNRALASIASAGGIQLSAEYVSMNDDGFTINVTAPHSFAPWAYEAIQ